MRAVHGSGVHICRLVLASNQVLMHATHRDIR